MSEDDTEYSDFETALDDDDFGFIVDGKTGKLKGLWIPKGNTDLEVPDTIIHLCVDYFDIDPIEFESDKMGDPPTDTLH